MNKPAAPWCKTALLALLIGVLLLISLAAGVVTKIAPLYFRNPPLLAAIFGAMGAIAALQTVLWLVIGRWWQLSYVYPFMGINYVLAWIIGVVGFHEPFRWSGLVGSVVIFAGTLTISASRHRESQAAPEAGAPRSEPCMR